MMHLYFQPLAYRNVKIECPCCIEIVRRPSNFILYYHIVLNVSISYELLNKFPNGCKWYRVVGVNQINTLLALAINSLLFSFAFAWVNADYLRHLYVRKKIILIFNISRYTSVCLLLILSVPVRCYASVPSVTRSLLFL